MKKQKHNKLCLIALIVLSTIGHAHAQINPKPLPVQKVQKTILLSEKDSVILSINDILNSFAGKANDCETWAAVQGKIWNLLATKWYSGLLKGSKPEEAFFVQTGKQAMTQIDIQQGKLIVLVGFSFYKPAEFEIRRFEKQL